MQTVNTLQILPALHQGGVERSTLEMATYLQQQGWQPHVASVGGHMVGELDAHNIPHHTLPLHSKNPLTLLLNAFRLWRLVKQQNIQLMHVRSRAPAVSVWLANKLSGVPYIATFHGTYGHKSTFKRWYNRFMLRGRAVIANSKFIRSHIQQIYGISEKQIDLAQRGFDPTFFNPKNIKKSDLTTLRKGYALAEKPILLMVGRLTRWKGQLIFLETLKQLKTVHPKLEWHALIVGSAKTSAYETELQDFIRQNNLTEHVTLTGARSDIPTLNALANVAISASTEPEAFGRTALEAQAMGTPVIATAHGGSLETVQDGITGWLIPPNNAEKLAEKLAYALTHPKKLATMGSKAQAWAHAHFTAEKTSAAEFEVYKRILSA